MSFAWLWTRPLYVIAVVPVHLDELFGGQQLCVKAIAAYIVHQFKCHSGDIIFA